MTPLEVTARQFKDNPNCFFEQADNGRQVVIKRGRKPSYILTPFIEDELAVTPALMAKIERADQQMKEGKYTECKTWDDSLKFLNSL